MTEYLARRQDVDYDSLVATAKFYEDGAGSNVQKAARITTAKFMAGFPGWQIHWRICSGSEHFDRSIEAYFIGLARRISRLRKKNGFAYIGEATRSNHWIRQAARDAMDYVFFGRFAEGINERAVKLGVANKTYQKLRDPLALGMRMGIDRWQSEFNYQMSQLYFDLKIPEVENRAYDKWASDFSAQQMKPAPAGDASTDTDATNVAGKPERPAPIHPNRSTAHREMHQPSGARIPANQRGLKS